VSSSAFSAGGDIPTQFSCKGDNMNPPLEIHGVPSTAKSLVLILDDPDAPGGLFTHWIVWNILPSTSGIAQKSVPGGGVEGTNGFGKKGYGGPCPPSGTHRYIFHIFALDQKLDLHAGAKRAALDKAIASHIIGRGELTARFSH
jgi:Raf kinase inhibitor-like YbhB/YbcL family protein